MILEELCAREAETISKRRASGQPRLALALAQEEARWRASAALNFRARRLARHVAQSNCRGKVEIHAAQNSSRTCSLVAALMCSSETSSKRTKQRKKRSRLPHGEKFTCKSSLAPIRAWYVLDRV
eukprot:6213449-Pleurochrysis_carterae.AAC.5